MRPPGSILETVLYAEDLDAAHRFYAGVLGLELLGDLSDLSAVFRVGPGQVLLVFDPRHSAPAGRSVPSHGAAGPGHIALRIPPEDLDGWTTRFRACGVPVEHTHDWDGRGRSVYVRDPAGNSVELITADIWPAAQRPGPPLLGMHGPA